MIDFLNTITNLILNIFGYLLLDSSLTLVCFFLVGTVFYYFRRLI